MGLGGVLVESLTKSFSVESTENATRNNTKGAWSLRQIITIIVNITQYLYMTPTNVLI